MKKSIVGSFNARAGGFTLIELLVVMVVIVVLAGLVGSAFARGKTKSGRIGCLNNERQMGVGSLLFAAEDDNHAFTGTANYSDDDLNWLYPKYVNDLKVFMCPSTKNNVSDVTINFLPTYQGPNLPNVTGVFAYKERDHGINSYVKDLINNASGRNATVGSSYEVAGYFCAESGTTVSDTSNVRKTLKTVGTHVHQNFYSKYNYVGRIASPSEVMIIYDADDASASPTSIEDFPDAADNHGADGGNMVFCDGHAAWVPASVYAGTFIKSTDESGYTAANR